MRDGTLPAPDERFTQLILDYFAAQHLFIAEGEGARCILDLLSAKIRAPGRKAIYYADTVRNQSTGLSESLRTLEVKSVEVFQTRLELLRALPAVFSQTSPPFRVYIAASAWFIQAAEAIAEQAGIDKELIMIERCEAWLRRVSCALCHSQTVSRTKESLKCSSCGTALLITDYYRQKDHSHLGVPADWPRDRIAGDE